MLYACIQGIVAEYWLMIFLASSDILIGAKISIADIHPTILESCVLWNILQLYFRNGSENPSR